MKAHVLAQLLLEGPNLPVVHWDGEPPYPTEVEEREILPSPLERWRSEHLRDLYSRWPDGCVELL